MVVATSHTGGHEVVYALLVAGLLLVLIALAYRLLARSIGIRSTRVGFFVEREYVGDDNEEGEKQDTQVLWPRQEER